MVLKANKVYKIRHKGVLQYHPEWSRDYIICSPKEDVIWGEGSPSMNFSVYFTVCFDKSISVDILTSFSKDCTIEKITIQDYLELRYAVTYYNATHDAQMNYNGKKKCLIFK